MTEITPELKALADAALEFVELGTSRKHSLALAANAYRATQAKECRPPDGAKDRYYWLVGNSGTKIVARWYRQGWMFFGGGTGLTTPKSAHELGWTVDSECRFGETGVSVTCEEIDQFLKSRGVELLNTTLFHLTEFIEQVRAPKLEISDEEILDVAGQHTDWPTGAPSGGLLASQLTQIVRAVIAKVGGEK